MPEKMKPFGRLKCALLSAVVLFGLTVQLAAAAEWPRKMPKGKFEVIPKESGIAFFYGAWKPIFPSVSHPVVIEKNFIDVQETGERHRYRTFFEAPNHILAVAQKLAADGHRHPTRFLIFAVQDYNWLSSRSAMYFQTCEWTGPGTAEAFDWPPDRLITAFKSSRCFLKQDMTWNNNGYIRETAWPLDFPVEQFAVIPDGQGIDYFIDTWDPASRGAPDSPLTITENTFESRKRYSPHTYEFKILHEAPNYILTIARSPGIVLRPKARFVLLAIPYIDHPPIQWLLAHYYYCGSLEFEVFERSAEELLEVFKRSHCLSILIPGKSTWIGWNAQRYQRAGL